MRRVRNGCVIGHSTGIPCKRASSLELVSCRPQCLRLLELLGEVDEEEWAFIKTLFISRLRAQPKVWAVCVRPSPRFGQPPVRAQQQVWTTH